MRGSVTNEEGNEYSLHAVSLEEPSNLVPEDRRKRPGDELRHSLDGLDHSHFVVFLGILLALPVTPELLEPGLVVVRLLVEDEALDGHEDLEQARLLGPLLRPAALPRAEQAHADLAVFVEVRVEAVRDEGYVVDAGRAVWVLCGQQAVEEEQAALVRRSSWPLDHCTEQILGKKKTFTVSPFHERKRSQYPLKQFMN